MKILDVLWFTQGQAPNTIGIVKVQTDYDGIQHYVGTGQGFSSDFDMQQIASWGARVVPEVMQSFLNSDGTNPEFGLFFMGDGNTQENKGGEL